MKYIYLLILAFAIQISLVAKSKVILGEEEIRKSPYTKFENRSDKYATPERKALEIEIGKGLHELVVQSDKPVTYKGFTLQRFYSGEKGKYGGDILLLKKNSNYGHINSIKRILSAYIQYSFGYSEKNADTLVLEILYYNAQNRFKLDRIKEKYTKDLVASLDKKKVGISTKFSDWAGNTQLIIPIKFSEPTDNKNTEAIQKDNKTPTENNPENENEKIKHTKAKIPSSEMPTENIIKNNKTIDKDVPVITVEKKKIKIKEDDKTNSTTTESELDEPTKKQNNSIPSNKKVPTETDEFNNNNDDKIDEKEKPAKDLKIPKNKNSNKKSTKETVTKDKNLTNNTKNVPKKDSIPTIIVDNSDKPVKNKPKDKIIKEGNNNTETGLPNNRNTDKSTSNNDPKKETDKPATKDDPKKDVNKSVTKNDPKKDTDKSVAIVETKKDDFNGSNKNAKKEELKIIPEIKKDTSKPLVKKKVNKVSSKEEIKKMQKELTELKKKEKDKVENSDNVVGEKIVFLKVKEFLAEGHYSSEMWALDTENDDVLFQSPFKKVCGKEFKELGTGVVVMSFKENDIIGKDTHHLALLDKESLKLIKQTQEVIFWRSFLKEQNGKIYTIEIKDGKYYLAQFKDDLSFEMRSNEPINPDCEIAFKKNKIYLTKRSADNTSVSIRVLNRDNLTLRDTKVMK